jgi:hypothetical protein
VNSLRTLEEVVPQGVPEPQCRPRSVQKISLVLDKVPKHLQPDLIALVPKLIDFSEYSWTAYALLEHLQRILEFWILKFWNFATNNGNVLASGGSIGFKGLNY